MIIPNIWKKKKGSKPPTRNMLTEHFVHNELITKHGHRTNLRGTIYTSETTGKVHLNHLNIILMVIQWLSFLSFSGSRHHSCGFISWIARSLPGRFAPPAPRWRLGGCINQLSTGGDSPGGNSKVFFMWVHGYNNAMKTIPQSSHFYIWVFFSFSRYKFGTVRTCKSSNPIITQPIYEWDV